MSRRLLSKMNGNDLNISKCIKRVTQGMINCDLIIVSRSNLSEDIQIPKYFPGSWNKYEKEAAYFYKKQGYDVIRLEHFASCGVGEKEDIFEDSKRLGKLLREFLPQEDYKKYIYKSEQCREAVALNGVYPKYYSLSFCPPDFLVVNKTSSQWKFVEVKGPTDKLHFRQANWYINLMPSNWDYEIFASLNKEFEEIYIENDLPKKGNIFDDLYAEKVRESDKFNNMIPKRQGS
ncbi:MAG: VRR-NUC domain-containing protein [Methylococcales bacterium]|nr:VRR-NUC domain-containing protein [Methylococcales bacterium]